MALLAEFFGGKPKVPAFTPVNAQDVQAATISGNTAALPATIAQTSAINAAQFANIDKLLADATGGYYNRIKTSIGKNTADLVAGVIPQDVSNAVRTNAASRSLYGGFGGSGMGANLTARDLGLTSLDLIGRGIGAATRWMSAVNNIYQPVSVGAMFARNTISPEFGIQQAVEERNAKFQHDYVQNQWDWYGSLGQRFTRFEDTLVQLAGSIAGAAGA